MHESNQRKQLILTANKHVIINKQMKPLRFLYISLFLSLSFVVNAQFRYGIQLPSIPSELRQPEERATFLAIHFWDNVDFGKEGFAGNKAMIDHNFADYLTLYPILSDEGRKKAVDAIIGKTTDNKEAYLYIVEMAEKYLFEPQSPVFDDLYYAIFLENILNDSILTDAEKTRPRFLLEDIMKNLPGNVATDFEFELLSGEKSALSLTGSDGDILLIFFDPDCDHCRQVIDELQSNHFISEKIKKEGITVVAIYSGDEKDVWEAYSASLPSNWIVGYEPGEIFEEALYSIRSFPTLYVLDKDHKVKARNINLSYFED